ncbi:MAG: sarcosine oxidase subunit gamma [Paracoccus sp. (in: a-proteobacteria)]|uniref:sarcosine oxidase subunit gamma n=1 Tax=Paracoccus sp. TaxID=267 RepID=UPI0026DEEBE3|nr:sarcosine oxidase subunit gamma [Paracoccus sp. (in: a-proteobacteria)]MDO5630793.1 sarcosine oxidase subunit gamma [Paracoccus sp. (in: a-proteobacteria)]
MTDLPPFSALGDTTPRQAICGPLTICENSGLGLASLALRRGMARPSPFGLTLPAVGRYVTGAKVAAFWTGPDQWMIEGPDRAETDFARDVAAQTPGCSVTEQTDGFAAIEITGPAIPALMERLVNLDPLHFGPDSATRTGLHHQSVFVIRRAEDHLAIIGMRSAMGSLWHAVTQAARRLDVTI